jgi:hypothetical protein
MAAASHSALAIEPCRRPKLHIGLAANAFLANHPMAMNPMLYGLHKAIVVMTMKWSCLGGSADGNDRSQGDGSGEKQAFHVKPHKHWG